MKKLGLSLPEMAAICQISLSDRDNIDKCRDSLPLKLDIDNPEKVLSAVSKIAIDIDQVFADMRQSVKQKIPNNKWLFAVYNKVIPYIPQFYKNPPTQLNIQFSMFNLTDN